MALEEAETKIRQVTKDEYFKHSPKAAIDRKIFAVIRESLKAVSIPSLKRAAEISLLEFYTRQYRELSHSLFRQAPVIAAIALLNGRRADGTAVKASASERAAAWRVLENSGYTGPRIMGVPAQKYSQEYIKKNVQPALDRLAEQYPYDPDTMTELEHRNSLRNRAEIEVRGKAQEDAINGFKASGTRLVICSTHADCSARCRPYQGRVYSLDGTRGRTDDGREFVPLEEATQNPRDRYVTRAGRVWQNGLLGFNCRHFLVPYQSGYRFPPPDVKTERREYAITETQRRLERHVREWRTKAVEYKGVSHEKYLEARAKAVEWNRRYIEFSKKNKRAYYPSRTRLI